MYSGYLYPAVNLSRVVDKKFEVASCQYELTSSIDYLHSLQQLLLIPKEIIFDGYSDHCYFFWQGDPNCDEHDG